MATPSPTHARCSLTCAQTDKTCAQTDGAAVVVLFSCQSCARCDYSRCFHMFCGVFRPQRHFVPLSVLSSSNIVCCWCLATRVGMCWLAFLSPSTKHAVLRRFTSCVGCVLRTCPSGLSVAAWRALQSALQAIFLLVRDPCQSMSGRLSTVAVHSDLTDALSPRLQARRRSGACYCSHETPQMQVEQGIKRSFCFTACRGELTCTLEASHASNAHD